ncbi:hypothetical protein SLS53_004060 [Cytospora paraplurivora]|uniref:SAP domain-containing protein n=1 Tax=Cytospora paraplurivora TaxID=2898453 RepID=A0AAN9YGV6_9PEZI
MKNRIREALPFRRRSDTVPNVYSPIDSSKEKIRVIHLLPGEFDDEINIELATICLIIDPPPHYDALSYVWGTAQSRTPALVNGKAFTITSNLDVALRYFRDKVVEKVLWVDAVCINQGDNVEKGPQVQLMGQIYSKAAQVLIWLGPAADGSNELLDHMSAGEASEETVNPTLQDASLAMMTRPWFTRIWVQQEFALARQDPIFCCGRYVVSWAIWCDFILKILFPLEDAFREVMRRQEIEGVAIRPLPTDSDEVVEAKYQKLLQHIENNKKSMAIQHAQNKVQSLLSLRLAVEIASGILNNKMIEINAYVSLKTDPQAATGATGTDKAPLTAAELKRLLQEKGMDADGARKFVQSRALYHNATKFSRLLGVTRRLDATEARDKVFGLLGLAKFVDKPILADYNKTKRQVYSEAMVTIIREGMDDSYNIWSIVGSKRRGLPSWVPDLGGHNALGGIDIKQTDKAMESILRSSFRGVPLATFSDDYETLYVGGVELGRVQAVIEQPITEDPELANPDERFKLKDEVKTLVEESRIPIRTMWRTLIGTRDRYFREMTDVTWGGDQLEVLRSEAKMLEAVSIICGQHDIYLKEGQDCLSKDDLRFVQRQLFEVCNGNTLFLTDTGEVGLANVKVRKGDAVAALFGIGMPFVLRKHSSLSAVMKDFGRKEQTQASSYEMIDTCHIGEHEWGHPDVPRDVEEGDLYRRFGFQTFVID